MMCAPGDQEKSHYRRCEQGKPNGMDWTDCAEKTKYNHDLGMVVAKGAKAAATGS
jgi:hypothetical protein